MNYLKIRNFGPVKDATIELKPFLVLTGGQGTGKSTIAKLLCIFQDYYWYVSILEDNDTVEVLFLEYGISEYFNKNTYIEYSCNDIFITYQDSRFSFKHREIIGRDKLLSYYGDKISGKICGLLLSQELLTEDLLEKFLDKNLPFIKSYCASSLYIPTGRNIAATFSSALSTMIDSQISFDPEFIRFINYFERARKQFRIYSLPEMEDVTYLYEKKKEGIIIPQEDDIKTLPLSECSSGLQSLLPMVMTMDYCINEHMFESYIVEEPEQNLSPLEQLAVFRHIISSMKKCNNTVSHVITTHSPYLLSGINISLMAGQVAQHKEFSDEVSNILPYEYHLTPGSVAAYVLGDTDNYCKDIINPQTETIDQNYLDTTSTVIGQEFSKLYKLYIKTLKG